MLRRSLGFGRWTSLEGSESVVCSCFGRLGSGEGREVGSDVAVILGSVEWCGRKLVGSEYLTCCMALCEWGSCGSRSNFSLLIGSFAFLRHVGCQECR